MIRTVPDQSVFAWGRTRTLTSLDREGSPDYWAICAPGLLAASPWDVLDAHDVVTLSPAEFALRLGLSEDNIPPLHCLFTPQGVRVRLLCIDLTREPQRFGPSSYSYMAGRAKTACGSGVQTPLRSCNCEDRAGALIALPLFRQGPALWQGHKYGAPQIVTTISTHGWCGKMSGGHGPVHLVRLARSALSAAPEYLLPQPTEVSLLSHPDEPRLPKSQQRGIILERRIDLWNPDPDEALAFHIAPTCVDDLSTLGFTISPLQTARSARMVVVTASINPDPAHRSWIAGIQQTIHLQLTLTGAGSLDNTKEACFLVSTYVYSLPPRDKTTNPGSPFTQPRNPSLALLVEAPCADDSGGRRTLQFSTRETSERVVADAEFIVHADTHWDTDEFDLRVLRVRLERPSGGSGVSADSKSLWLSIDISERYKHRRPPNRTAFSSQILPVDEEQHISNNEHNVTNPSDRSSKQTAMDVSHDSEAVSEKKPVR